MTDDFFRARLDRMTDLKHPLAVLAQRMPWMRSKPARPRLLPTATAPVESSPVKICLAPRSGWREAE